MQGVTHLQFYYVTTDSKYVNNIFKEITVNVIVTTDLVNSNNLKVAITQLCNNVTGLQFHHVMQVFHRSRQAGNYAFLESWDQCLNDRLGSVVSSRHV